MNLRFVRLLLMAAAFAAGQFPIQAQPFALPTANRAVLDPNGGKTAFAGTAGREWPSGTFGCVRSDGYKFHEGIDIRSLQRSRNGEPTDPVMASAEGTVAYISNRPQLSNYGNYVVLRHYVERLEVYTLYAHLSAIEPGLKIGDRVRQGQRIATLGRTTNTREPITKDRAHCHFEINLVVNDRYVQWHDVHQKGVRNDHGNFNGHNLLGLDPWKIFLEQERLGAKFSLVQFIRNQPEVCRVMVRGANFPWAKRYRPLIDANPAAERDGVAGYEIYLTFNGLPCRLVPRSASELGKTQRTRLLSVNEPRLREAPCGKLLFKRGQLWTLTGRGEELLSLVMWQ